MTLDEKMFQIMGSLKLPCKNHGMSHRGVVGLIKTVHKLAEHGRLKELNQIYKDMKCPKLKGYFLDVYNDAVKKKAHRLINNGEIKKLDALYRAQNCEKLHEYIMSLYNSEKTWKDMGL